MIFIINVFFLEIKIEIKSLLTKINVDMFHNKTIYLKICNNRTIEAKTIIIF